MSENQAPTVNKTQIVYGEIIYWITVVAAIICMIGPVVSVASPENNVMNPYELFNKIFEGEKPEDIWNSVGGGHPGGHFYFKHFTKGDAITQFGLALGCSSALWGLLAASVFFAREKNWLWVILGLWVSLMVLISMVGIDLGGH